jgi:hypothetical protein
MVSMRLPPGLLETVERLRTRRRIGFTEAFEEAARMWIAAERRRIRRKRTAPRRARTRRRASARKRK